MQDVDDAKNRGEAAYLANLLIGQMWLDDRLTTSLTTKYASTPGSGSGFADFKTMVEQRLPNADQYDQLVDIRTGVMPANLASSEVTITILWCPPGEWKLGSCRGTNQPHQFNISAAIGAN